MLPTPLPPLCCEGHRPPIFFSVAFAYHLSRRALPPFPLPLSIGPELTILHDAVRLEQANALGMDSHSVSFTLPDETEEWRVDVPMRSFQGGRSFPKQKK